MAKEKAGGARRTSASDLKKGMAIWVWSRRPARIVQSYGDGSYEVDYVGEDETDNRVSRSDLDPMDPQERQKYLPKPRLEPDRNAEGDPRTPLRKFMDEWPISRAQMIKVLGFSPPKVDRLIADMMVPLPVAALLHVLFGVEVDPAALPEAVRPHLDEALAAAREGADNEG